ncbi:MAG: hypothetical protein IPM74_17095 [Crocinitomicaceae bacterium]|nr:hypothetical protein [Crocinitomicaceae bacterium]
MGDLKTVFDEYYAETNSLLLPENRLRAHNQFLTAWIATGVVGFTCTLFFFVCLFSNSTEIIFSMICLLSIFISFK